MATYNPIQKSINWVEARRKQTERKIEILDRSSNNSYKSVNHDNVVATLEKIASPTDTRPGNAAAQYVLAIYYLTYGNMQKARFYAALAKRQELSVPRKVWNSVSHIIAPKAVNTEALKARLTICETIENQISYRIGRVPINNSCPTCGCTLDSEKFGGEKFYCDKCGQAIVWNEGRS